MYYMFCIEMLFAALLDKKKLPLWETKVVQMGMILTGDGHLQTLTAEKPSSWGGL